MHPRPHAAFVPSARGGHRLYLHHASDGPAARGCIVHVHAWAEEMNKARPMVAAAARDLRQHGFDVLLVDLEGCGDSSHAFSEATWQGWIEDVVAAAAWLRARQPQGPMWLWGLRAGCLLAADAARQIPGTTNLLLWQPVPQGRQALQQFLRLSTAARWIDSTGQDSKSPPPRAELQAGRTIEVAGYPLTPWLAQGLEASRLDPIAERPARLVWLDVSAGDTESGPGPAARGVMAAWETAGWHVTGRSVTGPAFWQTTEIEHAPALISATREALAS